MTVRLAAVTFDVPDARVAANFWAQLLGREAREHDGGLLLPGDTTQVGLRFVTDPSTVIAGNRDVHLHVTSAAAPSQQHVVDRAVACGASPVDVGQLDDEGHVVLAAPDGHPFCVIEPGNSYLAGTGLLGEVACDGSRAVGTFWSAALGWPLVWDQDGETAIQSPEGGTKVAWGGRPVTPLIGPLRQRFDLAVPADDLAPEIDRLVALGATHRASGISEVVLADPEGNQFGLAQR
ncbi:VOC family protein [Aeromicrobium sp. CF3.5]|uniref:VOC family protein n=1 Tax=Aeromicrobium sp. CF3.5 TaxID=3373078 RepID=UPI003EE4C76C